MQQVFLSEGAAAGRVVIPMISWANEASLRRQVELWASMPQVNTILLNCYASGVNRTAWRQRWLTAMRRYMGPRVEEVGADGETRLLTHEEVQMLIRGGAIAWPSANRDPVTVQTSEERLGDAPNGSYYRLLRRPPIRWIITGMTPGWAIRELNEIFPERNYSLLLSGADFIAPQRSATDRELMARRYQRTIRKVEDFRTGRTLAAAIEMPEEILSFSQCLV
jgi:hypothetical protein